MPKLTDRLSSIVATCLCGLALSLGSTSSTFGAAGDTYEYRIVNAYNSETVGRVSYRIDQSQPDRVQASVTTDPPAAAAPRKEVTTRDGNWLVHTLPSHEQLQDYQFSAPFPVVTPPGDDKRSWSVRMNALVPQTGKENSVRVDAKVIGNERITVPAGTFDTVRIYRRIYGGDWEAFKRETNIEQTDWFAPALGIPVRSESRSSWQDLSRCARGGCPWFRGDWNVFELTTVSKASPGNASAQ